MRNKNLFLILSSGISMLIMLSLVGSFMPNTHWVIWQKSMQTPVDSEFYSACLQFPELCFAGNTLVDSSVIWYYTSSQKYSEMHSVTFCKKLIENVAKIPGLPVDQARACAIGGCTHLPADLVSHSKNGQTPGLVSYAITHSLLANQVVHVFSEQHLDNFVVKNDPLSTTEYKQALVDGYTTCEPLFVTSMMGDSAYADMSQADIEGVFDTFIREIVNSQTGYDVGFKDKSFFVTLKSIPLVITTIYVLVMAFFLLISVLLVFKIFKKQAKLRHYVGLIIFLPLFILLAYVMWGALNGSAFNSFINVIKPISNLVPIGNPQSYIDQAVSNTNQLFSQGPTWLEGKDPSGVGAIPVLIQATSEILIYDYIIMAILGIVLIWFIWFLFKKNKIINKGEFNL